MIVVKVLKVSPTVLEIKLPVRLEVTKDEP
jgi:hypothetical protein